MTYLYILLYMCYRKQGPSIVSSSLQYPHRWKPLRMTGSEAFEKRGNTIESSWMQNWYVLFIIIVYSFSLIACRAFAWPYNKYWNTAMGEPHIQTKTNNGYEYHKRPYIGITFEFMTMIYDISIRLTRVLTIIIACALPILFSSRWLDIYRVIL